MDLRFKLEKEKLEETFGDFVSFPKGLGKRRVEVKGKTSKGNKYTLRCYVEEDLLNSMPTLVVCEPDEPLVDSKGNELGISSENHCWGKDEYENTIICHCRKDRWDHTMNLCQVFIKGFIWLEAYDNNTLHSLPEMPMTEDELKRAERELREMRRVLHDAFEDHINRLMFHFNCQSVEELFQVLAIQMFNALEQFQ